MTQVNTKQQSAEKPEMRVALVTGGASGIGLSIAKALVARSCQVIITDIDQAQGLAAGNQVGARFIAHDVSLEDSWISLMDTVRREFGRLDILVNNAGIYLSGSIEDATIEDWTKLQAVNVVGVLLGCKYAIEMMKGGGGAIVNMSSGAALRPNSAATAYSATKSAVWSITRTTALHCAEQKYGIRCNSVHPGMVDTDMVSSRVQDEQSRQALHEKIRQIHPLGRMAEVDDVAAAVVFLASDEASYLTGVALPVDGGYAIN